MRKLVLAVSASVLAGCVATAPSTPVKPVTQPTPACHTKKECEAMWIAAGEEVSRIGGMKIATQTDSVIETYNSTRVGRLAGRVVKFPLASSDGYEIRVDFSCPQYGCERLIPSATDLFNMRVNSAGIPFREEIDKKK